MDWTALHWTKSIDFYFYFYCFYLQQQQSLLLTESPSSCPNFLLLLDRELLDWTELGPWTERTFWAWGFGKLQWSYYYYPGSVSGCGTITTGVGSKGPRRMINKKGEESMNHDRACTRAAHKTLFPLPAPYYSPARQRQRFIVTKLTRS